MEAVTQSLSMKVICSRKDLHEGVQTVSRAVAGRSALPILNNVLIRTEDDHLRLMSFDLEMGIECSIPATVEEAGALTVPARATSWAFLIFRVAASGSFPARSCWS